MYSCFVGQDHLLQCLQLCVAKFLKWKEEKEEGEGGGEEEGVFPAVVEEGRDLMQSVAERMRSSDLEDFELVREGEREREEGWRRRKRTGEGEERRNEAI